MFLALFDRTYKHRADKVRNEIMLILLLGSIRQIYSKNVVIITDTKCRDQVSDQELGDKHNITKHVIQSTNCLSLTSDHLSWVGDLI